MDDFLCSPFLNVRLTEKENAKVLHWGVNAGGLESRFRGRKGGKFFFVFFSPNFFECSVDGERRMPKFFKGSDFQGLNAPSFFCFNFAGAGATEVCDAFAICVFECVFVCWCVLGVCRQGTSVT
jgi:hypothetical protein